MKWIIGDVHGCYDTLIALLKKLPEEATPKDIIFLGDLVDRGKNNRKVINLVQTQGYDCVQGNHEGLMIESIEDYWKYETPIWYSNWVPNGGDATYAEYQDDEEGLKKDIEWMKTLTNHIVYPMEKDPLGRSLIVSHAPCLDFIEDYWDMEEGDRNLRRNEELITWNRGIPKKSQTKYFNVFGHNIIGNFIFNPSGGLKVDESIITPEGTLLDRTRGYAAIDTGAFVRGDKKEKAKYFGKLSCTEFPTMKLYQQENIEKEKDETNDSNK